MDVKVPIIDGYSATHLIRHHWHYKSTSGHIPIVAMTASAIHGDRERCMRTRMDDYVAKPVKGKTLKRTLDRWRLKGRGRRLDSENGGRRTGRRSTTGTSAMRFRAQMF
jgi:CheY-like chemotaxis protein